MPGPEVAPDLLAQAAAYDVEEAEAQVRRRRRRCCASMRCLTPRVLVCAAPLPRWLYRLKQPPRTVARLA